ncbi:MAG: L,D-transpeptidase family protein [Pseudonocardia sp.]|nr:L,D-transpeptidase family protein [Pseudonocardia sp.]
MGRHLEPRIRRRAAVAVRIATVIGVACVAGIAVAVPAMAAAPPAPPTLIGGTVCTTGARACVDLVKQKAWLIDPTGKVVRGPVQITSGGPGQETLPGTFKVIWKDKNHVSNESKTPQGAPAPMPWSVFFEQGGVAFHGGSLERASAGCVHLADADAQVFYNTLQIGDQVQVHNGNDVPQAKESDDGSQPKDGDNSGGSSDGDDKPGDKSSHDSGDAKPASSQPSDNTDDSSSGDGKPSSDSGPDSHSALDLDRSPVNGGPLAHRL